MRPAECRQRHCRRVRRAQFLAPLLPRDPPDREIQRTLMELLSQLDGFETLGQVKIVMATNRPDVLDPALLRCGFSPGGHACERGKREAPGAPAPPPTRPGRLDRKIEIPLPNDGGRLEILKIHAGPISKRGEFDWDAVSCRASARRLATILLSSPPLALLLALLHRWSS